MEESENHLLYKDYISVTVFPYVQRESDVDFVLLRDTQTGKIIGITGMNASVDASILFTVARSLLRETNGLFTATNLLTANAQAPKPLVLRNSEHYSCNLLLNEPEFNSLLSHLARTAEHTTTSRNVKVLAFPIASLNLKEFNSYLEATKSNYELISVSALTVKETNDLNLEPVTAEFISSIITNVFSSSLPFVINQRKRKHYAVITCYDPTISSRLYDHCEYLLQGHFRRQDETWHCFKASFEEYPDLALLEKLEGIIIPGAVGSCYSPDIKWIPKLEEFIRHIYNNTNTRYLGLCYGAQILAQALGGKVEKNVEVGFRAATEHITLDDEFFELPFVKAHKSFCARRPKSVCFVKSHNDHVTKLPKDAKLYGSSKTTRTEIYTVGDRFFATQGHPEYTSDFVCSRDSKVRISEATDEEIRSYEEAKALKMAKNYSEPADSFDLRTICMNFLKKIE